IFGELTFDYDKIKSRLQELAFLNKGLTIHLNDERIKTEETFRAEAGLLDYVKHLNRHDDGLHPPIVFEKLQDGVVVEVGMQYTGGDEDRYRCYTNNAYNSEGGLHLSGFRSGLTRTLNVYGAKENLFKNVSPIGDDFREGLTLVLSVKVPEPKFN